MFRFVVFTALAVSAAGLGSATLLGLAGGALVPTEPGARGDSGAPPADLHERLRRRKEDRDNKLRQARIEVHPHANKFLRELEGYESAANFHLSQWAHYFRNGPPMAALGVQLPRPAVFNKGHHEQLIRLAREDCARGIEQCRIKIEQIEFEYYKDLAALQQGNRDAGNRAPPPETSVDSAVQLAQRLLPATETLLTDVWEEYAEKHDRSITMPVGRISILPLYLKAAREGAPFPVLNARANAHKGNR